MSAGNHLFLGWARESTWFCVGRLSWLDFCVGNRIWLDFSLVMKLISLLCGSSKLTWFLNAGQKSLVFSVSMYAHTKNKWFSDLVTSILCGWPKLTWFQFGGSNLTGSQCRMKLVWLCGLSRMISFQRGGLASVWVYCSGRKWLVFRVRFESNWVFVSGHRNRLDSRIGIEIDLISVMGSKINWFQRTGTKLTWF